VQKVKIPDSVPLPNTPNYLLHPDPTTPKSVPTMNTVQDTKNTRGRSRSQFLMKNLSHLRNLHKNSRNLSLVIQLHCQIKSSRLGTPRLPPDFNYNGR